MESNNISYRKVRTFPCLTIPGIFNRFVKTNFILI